MDIETRMREKPHVSKGDIVAGLVELGIERGDIVMFHSSLSSMGYVEGGADTVIDAFLEAVGEGGTVVVPTICPEGKWDVRETPSTVGRITERFRKREGSIRSDHPTHSVAAMGRFAEEITKYHGEATGSDNPNIREWAAKGAFGPGSAWEKLYELDAKYMLLGADFNSCTLFHYAQEVLVAEWGKVDGEAPWPDFHFAKMGDSLWERGVVRRGAIGEAAVQLMQSLEMIDATLCLLRSSFLDYGIGEDDPVVKWYEARM